MDKKRSCCCWVLPATWKWLLLLLGLPLLFMLMMGSRQGVIEGDLASRSEAALKDAGMDWAKVNLAGRGRDLQLQGTAGSETERGEAVKLVQNVYGVRDVQNLIDITVPGVKPGSVISNLEPRLQVPAAPTTPEEPATLAATEIQESQKVAVEPEQSTTPSETAGLSEQEQSVAPPKPEVSAAVEQVNADVVQEPHAGAKETGQEQQQTDDNAASAVGEQEPQTAPAGAKETGQEQQQIDDNAASAVGEQEPQIASAGANEAGQEQQQVADNATSVVEKQAVQDCQQQLNNAMGGKTILFATDKVVIKQGSAELLDSLAGIISTCKSVFTGRILEVSGHTDNVGNDAYNQKLSQQRADAVKDYLVNKGIDSLLIKSVGYGESQPVASNGTAEGRSQNRRISFEIKPE